MGVHCGIYKGFYSVSTVSYLNSPPALLLFMLPSPDSRNSFNRYHLHLHTSVYIFVPYLVSYPLCLSSISILITSPSNWCQPSPLGRACSLVLLICRREKRKYKCYTSNSFINKIFIRLLKASNVFKHFIEFDFFVKELLFYENYIKILMKLGQTNCNIMTPKSQ
jgi:hypothetical protein